MATSTELGRPFTVDDLETMPEDGRRYELLDGQLLVSPAPGWAHQSVLLRLVIHLDAFCPRSMRVLPAPFAVQFDRLTELQPDVLVARYEDLTMKNLPVAPVLAVEIISPSSGLTDRNLKRAAYARYGVASYWIVDPDRELPSVTILALDGDDYREVARVSGAEAYDATVPFPVRVEPAELVSDLRP